MRADLPENAVRVEDAPCGCERYEIPTSDAFGAPRVGLVCLHVCEDGKPKKAAKK